MTAQSCSRICQSTDGFVLHQPRSVVSTSTRNKCVEGRPEHFVQANVGSTHTRHAACGIDNVISVICNQGMLSHNQKRRRPLTKGDMCDKKIALPAREVKCVP